jgi:hypothetical protein
MSVGINYRRNISVGNSVAFLRFSGSENGIGMVYMLGLFQFLYSHTQCDMKYSDFKLNIDFAKLKFILFKKIKTTKIKIKKKEICF